VKELSAPRFLPLAKEALYLHQLFISQKSALAASSKYHHQPVCQMNFWNSVLVLKNFQDLIFEKKPGVKNGRIISRPWSRSLMLTHKVVMEP
jgi:hypothetical protein